MKMVMMTRKTEPAIRSSVPPCEHDRFFALVTGFVLKGARRGPFAIGLARRTAISVQDPHALREFADGLYMQERGTVVSRAAAVIIESKA